MLILSLKYKDNVEAVRFSPDGRSLAAVAARGVCLWKTLTSSEQPKTFPDLSGWVQFSFDGTKLLQHRHHQFVMQDVTSDSPAVVSESLGAGFFTLTPDCAHVVGIQFHWKDDSDGRIVCLPITNPVLSAATWSHRLTQPGYLYSLAFITEDTFILWTRIQCDVRDRRTGEVLSRTQGPEIGQTAVSRDKQLLAGLSGGNRVLIFATNDFSKPVTILKNDSKRTFTDLAFHPSGKYLATTSNDKTVKVYDVATGQIARTFTWEIGRMRCVAFSPDGTLVAAGSDKGRVVVWDVDV